MGREVTTLHTHVGRAKVSTCLVPASSFRNSRCMNRCFGYEGCVAKFANSTNATIVVRSVTKL